MALPEGLPERTLGWAILDWATENLIQPDRQGWINRDPWVFQPDQAKFVLWWYAVDENGEWIYRRAYRERAKGVGKTPMAAAIACAEFLGPVLFDHFDPSVPGGCVGKVNMDAQIQLAAVAVDQCKQTFVLIMKMLDQCSEKFGLEIGKAQIQMTRRGDTRVVEMVTNSSRVREGARPTFAIFDETHHWLPADGGPDFAETVTRNLQKFDARSIELTNAPCPGQGSVAELTHQYWKMICDGEALDDGLLFDTVFIQVEDIYDREQAIPALREMYKFSPWIKIEGVFRLICDPRTREVNARRFYFNEMVDPRGMWIDDKTWNSVRDTNLKLKKRDIISLGFKAKRHYCAIVATRLTDQAVFLLKLWERPLGAGRDWEVPYLKIDDKVRNILDSYNVYSVVASPETFRDIIGRWAVDYEDTVQVEELWTSRNVQKNCDNVEQFETAVETRRMRHDGDSDLARHISNCFVDEVAQGVLIRPEKPGSDKYIVAAEAAVLSMYAALTAIEDGALKEGPDDQLFSF